MYIYILLYSYFILILTPLASPALAELSIELLTPPFESGSAPNLTSTSFPSPTTPAPIIAATPTTTTTTSNPLIFDATPRISSELGITHDKIQLNHNNATSSVPSQPAAPTFINDRAQSIPPITIDFSPTTTNSNSTTTTTTTRITSDFNSNPKRLGDLISSTTTPMPSPSTQTTPVTQMPTTPIQYLKAKSRHCADSRDCNNGICVNKICFCPPGFTGDFCGTNIDECRLSDTPCLNNGTCIDGNNQYSCECQAGFEGDKCEIPIDMCADSPCKNKAKCINHRTDYTCECEPGWEGRHCEINVDDCLKNPCQNNGTCHDLVNGYECDCGNSGFTGKNCEVDFDDCASRPCSITAKECVDLINDYRCECYDGFKGKKCDIDIDDCDPNPCENNGTCHEKSINFRNTYNRSDMALHNGLREHNLSTGLDLSQIAGFTCECKEEYYGDRCEERKKCYTKSASELCHNDQAECVNVGSSYDCLINASFDGTGQFYATYRIRKAFKSFSIKEIFVKFKSFTGGLIMSFETGNAETSYADLHLNKTGLYFNGTTAPLDQNLNDLFDGNERDIRVELTDPIDIKGITLTRPKPEGQNFEDYHNSFKGCLMQVRLNNILVPFISYGAASNQTFEITDLRLKTDSGCKTCFERDCQNQGTCGTQIGYENCGYDRCCCPETFTGNFCELDVNECENNSDLCANGGTCENQHGGFRCNCKEGFKGEHCKEISDYCKAHKPCITGTCKNLAQGIYHCECPSSHFGKRCERKRDCINECHSLHAQCVNNVTCACLPGKREDRIMCEYIASCEQVEGELCHNGGTCRNTESGYHCICPEPYHGSVCQFVVAKHFDLISLVVLACVITLAAACAVFSFVAFRSVRKARATRGTYSPSTQEKFGNSANDLLKLPIPEVLI